MDQDKSQGPEDQAIPAPVHWVFSSGRAVRFHDEYELFVRELREYCRSIGVDYDVELQAAVSRCESELRVVDLTERELAEIAEDIISTTRDINW